MLYDINGLSQAEMNRLLATLRIFATTAKATNDPVSAELSTKLMETIKRKTCIRPEE